MTTYDPHNDLDKLATHLSAIHGTAVKFPKQALDRVRNWIDETMIETRWNEGKHPLDREIAFGARGEAVNRTGNDLRSAILRLQTRCNNQRTSLEDWADRYDQVRSMYDVQKHEDNRNANEHMYGMYVALELAMATLDKRDVAWLPYEGDSGEVKLFERAASVVADAERQMNDVRNKNTELEQRIMILRHTNFGLSRDTIDKQLAIDEAYNRGVREGKTEAREEYLHSKGIAPQSFNTD